MNIVHERKRLPNFDYTHSVIILLPRISEKLGAVKQRWEA